MKSGYAYTIIFMLVISAVFTVFLAGANAFYLPTIQKNEELARKKSILYVFGIQTDGSTPGVETGFSQNVKPEKLSGMDIYVKYGSGKAEGYAIPFTGSGLWGTIKGYMAVSADLQKVLGVDFTSHSETPGLGGRIDEAWFKEQFRNLTVQKGRGFTYKPDSDGQLDAVTGATITSKSVLKIINDVVESDVPKLEVK